MHRYALRDAQWERIKELLPGGLGSVGMGAELCRALRMQNLPSWQPAIRSGGATGKLRNNLNDVTWPKSGLGP